MQYTSLDDCSETLRDAYGFSVPPLYQNLHRSFASIWQTEETERGERWNQWIQSFRNLNLEKYSQEDDVQLMERALAHYTAGFEGGGNAEDDASTPPSSTNNLPIDLQEAELLQQLRALVQMGIPINRRAQFWSIFLNIKSKKQPGEYLALVQAALDREAEFKKAAALASYQTTTVLDTMNSTDTRDPSNAADEDYFCVTPLTASSSSSSSSSDSNSSNNSSPVTPSTSTPQDNYNVLHTSTHQDQSYEDWLPQIDKDLHRTFPDHPMMDTSGRAALRRILGAYSIRNPSVGYCQGLNFLAATFMLLFNEEDAFWCLVVVIEDLLPGYFDLKMVAPQVDGQVLAHLLRGSAPRVAQHLDNLQVDIPSATSAWFLVAFLNSLPLETCLRVWDVFFFERSSVVLFRAALALIDIYSQALLETDDSSEAYLLLQALGPMSFDSSRLVDSACIGFGHVNDAALRVLRDKYRPEVLEAMESMFSCDEELQTYFENAVVANTTLSRSQSFTETLAAAAARSAASIINGGGTTGSNSDAGSVRSISRENSILSNTTPLSSRPGSPLSRYNSSKSTLATTTAGASLSPRHSNSPGKHSSLAFSPLGPQHIPLSSSNSTLPLASHLKDHQQKQFLRSPSPLLVLRRSASAATLGGAVRRSHSSTHHGIHPRIDLHSLAAFVPDLNHPKIAALYKIAAKPSPRKKTLPVASGAAAAADGAASSITTTTTRVESNFGSKGSQDLSLQWQSALAQLPAEFQAALTSSSGTGDGNNRSLFENGATIDIGGLAGYIKALKLGQNESQNDVSIQETGKEEGVEESKNIKKKVLRRVTDGGALLGKKEMGLLFARNFTTFSKITPLDTDGSTTPSSPGSNAEKLEQLYRLREELAAEVAAAGRRQTAAMEASTDAVDTAEALHRQLSKIKAEIDVKMASLHSLYNRISSIDFEIAADEEEEQAEIAALEVSKAALEEFKEARAVQSALVAALMTAVGEVQGVRGNTSPRSPGSAKSGILRRYF